jgi:hypothetical protein
MKIQPGVGYTFDSSSKGFTFDTSEQFPSRDAQGDTHPFQVVPLGPEGSNFRYRVIPGTVNNLVPELDDVVSGADVLLDRTAAGEPNPPIGQLSIDTSTKQSWIYLRCGPDAASPYTYPDTNISNAGYPKVISSTVELSDSATYAYILLAKFDMDSATAPTTGVLSQFVTNSLWTERFKCGSSAAVYWWSTV